MGHDLPTCEEEGADCETEGWWRGPEEPMSGAAWWKLLCIAGGKRGRVTYGMKSIIRLPPISATHTHTRTSMERENGLKYKLDTVTKVREMPELQTHDMENNSLNYKDVKL